MTRIGPIRNVRHPIAERKQLDASEQLARGSAAHRVCEPFSGEPFASPSGNDLLRVLKRWCKVLREVKAAPMFGIGISLYEHRRVRRPKPTQNNNAIGGV